MCNGTETCSTCPADCGACPTCSDGVRNGTRPASTAAGPAPPARGTHRGMARGRVGVRSGSPTFTVRPTPASGGENLLPPTGSSANTPAPDASGTRCTVGAGTFRSGRGCLRRTPTTVLGGDGRRDLGQVERLRRPELGLGRPPQQRRHNAVVMYTLAAGSDTLDVADARTARASTSSTSPRSATRRAAWGQHGPTCTDGTQNGTETGVDCGGSCPACPTCTDGLRNGTETGIDCGGTCPAARRPTCTDGIQNGTETGVDCGGRARRARPARRREERDGDGRRLRRFVPGVPAGPARTDRRTERRRGVDCGGSCAACPTCSDGVRNGTETGVDCGGSCAACTPGATTSGWRRVPGAERQPIHGRDQTAASVARTSTRPRQPRRRRS